MKAAHILNVPLWSHGGVALLAREIAFGLADEFPTLVICPKSDHTGEANERHRDNITLLEWEPGLDHVQIAAFIVRCLGTQDVKLAIFHGGEFSWGTYGGRLSAMNRISEHGRLIVAINHQSNPLFSVLPTGKKQGMIAGFRSFVRFAVAWFFKNIQMIATDVEINVSRYEYRNSLRRYPLFKRKFKLVYHSRLTRMERDQDFKERKQKIILSVGHFAYRKGQHVLLKAFGRIAEEFPTWRLQLVGASNTGEYHSMLESIVDDLKIGSRVDFVTETHQPDEFFKRASIYVQPSLCEAYGLALQEAMYFGCACVGSEAGGITDSISDLDYLFPPGDDEKLAHILRQLVSSNDLLCSRMEHDFSEARRLKRDRDSMLLDYKLMFEALAAKQRGVLNLSGRP